ncbi:hypothetical protein COCSADRAFT_207037 [Bipolaris sorokiniana ND90Pr]|uniref:Uncharacterized protein n=1 Tax=Cochliobolus sativus (strain ND90Pr / ATCC 201652) TaxID=665912 RepID=M2T425_COCSN|nr:uncharacterized protein COCSADRAFT_207037 [Bipolaris sorokiniana ND90Pr]EMD69170.1 hypothetical protein COCSADRAFT_207037 [Bipolaris sorokiniana ND90Pr]
MHVMPTPGRAKASHWHTATVETQRQPKRALPRRVIDALCNQLPTTKPNKQNWQSPALRRRRRHHAAAATLLLPLSGAVLLTPDNPGNPDNLLVFPARLDST